jgi:hypothetical protein
MLHLTQMSDGFLPKPEKGFVGLLKDRTGLRVLPNYKSQVFEFSDQIIHVSLHTALTEPPHMGKEGFEGSMLVMAKSEALETVD